MKPIILHLLLRTSLSLSLPRDQTVGKQSRTIIAVVRAVSARGTTPISLKQIRERTSERRGYRGPRIAIKLLAKGLGGRATMTKADRSSLTKRKRVEQTIPDREGGDAPLKTMTADCLLVCLPAGCLLFSQFERAVSQSSSSHGARQLPDK